MKKLHSVAKSILGVAFLLSAAGCSTPGFQLFDSTPQVFDTHGPRFHDDAQVNAVLQFSSWDWTFLLRPEYSENGFLQQVHRDSLNQVLDRLNVRRGTAAVVVGWTVNGDALDKLVADWKSVLGRCGFQRVVILRAQEGNRLNGSVIIDDSILHVSSVAGPSQGG